MSTNKEPEFNSCAQHIGNLYTDAPDMLRNAEQLPYFHENVTSLEEVCCRWLQLAVNSPNFIKILCLIVVVLRSKYKLICFIAMETMCTPLVHMYVYVCVKLCLMFVYLSSD